jgi:hypothetical protein
MDWREAPGQKRMAISNADGSARSVRAINGYMDRYKNPNTATFAV